MMNTVQLIGRLTKDVDLRFTQSGSAVGSFTLAVNRNFTNQQGEREADFINCVIWKKAAENLSNFTRKGSLLGVEGRLQVRNYENQQGQRVYVTEVIVQNFTLLESKKEMEQRTGGQQYQQPPVQQQAHNPNAFQGYEYPQGQQMDFNEDDLPF
ncbi:single-stranded DNA-binding protein [Aerococcaceae bacterium NML191219]|nr:single-stranded DNA-binding protein [Aerococcaceae bacterium NML191219]